MHKTPFATTVLNMPSRTRFSVLRETTHTRRNAPVWYSNLSAHHSIVWNAVRGGDITISLEAWILNIRMAFTTLRQLWDVFFIEGPVVQDSFIILSHTDICLS
ncbi:hypothetical protein P879_05146 [Paragonimus westermani]|uniref:Uncharacterized protein n=1 Tax=Paragonimus westermani TaxID=34504 RepID=A0A8T0DTA9_9TREM|nr:hypothetical protein P879_05146 [Paragonimus westermani]